MYLRVLRGTRQEDLSISHLKTRGTYEIRQAFQACTMNAVPLDE